MRNLFYYDFKIAIIELNKLIIRDNLLLNNSVKKILCRGTHYLFYIDSF